MGKKIDFEDLMRMAKDTEYDDEFTSNMYALLERDDLSAKEIQKLWECRVAWEKAWGEKDVSLWESISEIDPVFALKAYFCEDATNALWDRISGNVVWMTENARWNFFTELPTLNPGSKILLHALSQIAQNCPDGISNSNLENLRACSYFKDSMLDKCGVVINEDEE